MAIVHGLLAVAIGTSVAAPFAAVATEVGNGSIGASHDSLSSVSLSRFETKADPQIHEVQLSSLFWLINGIVTSLILSADLMGRRRRARVVRDRGSQLRLVLDRSEPNIVYRRFQSLFAADPALGNGPTLDTLRVALKRACMAEEDPVMADVYWELMQCAQGAHFERLVRALDTSRRVGQVGHQLRRQAIEEEIGRLLRRHLLENLHPHERAVMRRYRANA